MERFHIDVDLGQPVVELHVVGARLSSDHEQLIRVDGLRHANVALARELPRHRAGLGHCAAVLGNSVAHVGDGPVAVVGDDVDEDADAVRAIRLVDGFDQFTALQLARAALDGPVDVVLGHIGRAGIGHGQAQGGVAVHVAAALARSNGDLLGDARKLLAALGVAGRLLMFNGGPF